MTILVGTEITKNNVTPLIATMVHMLFHLNKMNDPFKAENKMRDYN